MSVHLTSIKSRETSVTYHTRHTTPNSRITLTYILPYPVLCVRVEYVG